MLLRVWFGRTEMQWRFVLYFISTAIPFSIIGGHVFVDSSQQYTIHAGIGCLLIGIVILRRMNVTQFHFGNNHKYLFLLGGACTGFLSGLAGSAGPLGATFFLVLELPAAAYIASEAVTAMAMHITKIVVYRKYALIGEPEIMYGMLLGIGMILGSWTGKKNSSRNCPEKISSYWWKVYWWFLPLISSNE